MLSFSFSLPTCKMKMKYEGWPGGGNRRSPFPRSTTIFGRVQLNPIFFPGKKVDRIIYFPGGFHDFQPARGYQLFSRYQLLFPVGPWMAPIRQITIGSPQNGKKVAGACPSINYFPSRAALRAASAVQPFFPLAFSREKRCGSNDASSAGYLWKFLVSIGISNEDH